MYGQRVPENARFAQGIPRLELVPSAARMARLRNLCQGSQVQTPKPGYARVCKQTLKRPAARELTMQDMRDALVVLLAGGQGERLWPVSRDCGKPAGPFWSLYPIIATNLSNLLKFVL